MFSKIVPISGSNLSKRVSRGVLGVGALISLSACEPGPNGLGTAPPGMSQEAYERQVAARNASRRSYYSGPRGGASGR